LASTSCGTLFLVSHGFIEETQDPLSTNVSEATGQASVAGMSVERSSAQNLSMSSFVSDPSAKEDTDGLDIHHFRRFHVLNLRQQQRAEEREMLQHEHTVSCKTFVQRI